MRSTARPFPWSFRRLTSAPFGRFSCHRQDTAPDVSSAHLIQGDIDVVERYPVCDQPVEIEFTSLVKLDIAGNIHRWIGAAAFAADQYFAEMEWQRMNR